MGTDQEYLKKKVKMPLNRCSPLKNRGNSEGDTREVIDFTDSCKGKVGVKQDKENTENNGIGRESW